MNIERPKYYAERLFIFSLFSDDLPEESVGPWHPDYPMMKCKGNTVCGLFATVCNLEDENLVLDRRSTVLLRHFINYPWDFGRHTTSEEIELFNKTVQILFTHLTEEYDLNIDKDLLMDKFLDLKREARKNWGLE